MNGFKSIGMRNLLLIAAVLSAIVIYLNLGNTGTNGNGPDEPVSLEHSEYDYYMIGVDNTVFSADGDPGYRLQADRLTHYPTGDITVLEIPRFSLYPEEHPPWFISADNAQIEMDAIQDQPRISLLENVAIEHTDDEDKSLSIYTDSLVIYPEGKTLFTDQLVRISYPGFEITGTGMTVDMNTKQLRLLSEISARGTYE